MKQMIQDAPVPVSATGVDLRGFLDVLRERGEPLVRFTREVSREYELTAAVKLLERHGDPVVCFERVAGSELPIVVGVHGSRERIAAALGCSVEDGVEVFRRRAATPIEPRIVTDAPVHERRFVGDDVDLGRLPIPTHAEHDAGAFITSGVGLSRDPASGAVNAGIYRMRVISKNRLTIINNTNLRILIEQAEQAGEALEFAVSIGHHPAMQIGSQAKLPLDVDAFALVGSLLGVPLEVTAAETIDAMVPARAEIVLEGRILPGEREVDGAFGESQRYYQAELGFVFQVTAVTHRHDAMYVDINNVHHEHNCLSVFPCREAHLLSTLQARIPAVKAVYMPEKSAAMCAYISIDQRRDGEAKQALTLALGSFPRLKRVVAVDSDVDVRSHEEVAWAMTMRCQWDRDLIMIPYTLGSGMDPSTYTLTDRYRNKEMYELYEPDVLTTQVGIDATEPVGVPFPSRADTLPAQFADMDVTSAVRPWSARGKSWKPVKNTI